MKCMAYNAFAALASKLKHGIGLTRRMRRFECRCCQTRDSSVHKLSPHFNCIKCGVNNWKRSTKSKSKELLPGTTPLVP